MPQFLRCIKILCSLYPFYKQVSSTCVSPMSPNRRSDSLGSHLDTAARPNPRSRSFLNSWAGGHRRTASSDNNLEESRWSSSAVAGTVEVTEDPFDKLEMVWTSLESWFDLILKEIEKLSTNQLHECNLESTSSDTSQLAAAIILSAPPKRREVFLRTSSTSPPQADDRSSWRRSWHADRYVRVTLVTEEQEDQPVSLPIYHRSKSTDATTGEKEKGKVVLQPLQQ